jgi:hypothetical protein
VAFLNNFNNGRCCNLPLEKKEFGVKFTAVRNGLSFLFAIIIAHVYWG